MPAAMLHKIAEALSHVAGTVYETEDYPVGAAEVEKQRKGMALREAAKACRTLKATTGDVEVGFTAEEATLIPEALRLVAHEVFRGEGEVAETMNEVADQILPRRSFMH